MSVVALVLAACGPAAQQRGNPEPSHEVASLQRIYQEGGSRFLALTAAADASVASDPHVSNGAENPLGMHCVILQYQTNQYVCNSVPLNDSDAWALYDRVKDNWKAAAPDLVWEEHALSCDDAPAVVRSGPDATGAIVYGKNAQGAQVVSILIDRHTSNCTTREWSGPMSVTFSVVEHAVTPNAAPSAQAANASASDQTTLGATRLVCSIRFCTNIYYPDRCSDATRRYTIDLAHNSVSLSDGRTVSIQQSDNSVSWMDYYEYLSTPVSQVRFTVDRSTLEIHAESPGTTAGRCTMDQRRF